MAKKNIDIHTLISQDETILWEGTPDKKAYFANRIVGGGAFPFLWTFIGLYIIWIYNQLNIPLFSIQTIVVSFIIWNIPVWFWIYKVIFTGLALKNTHYVITDKGVYLKNGTQEIEVFITNNDSFTYENISEMRLHIGLIDKLFSVGDIYFVVHDGQKTKKYLLVDIKDIESIYHMTKSQYDKVSE